LSVVGCGATYTHPYDTTFEARIPLSQLKIAGSHTIDAKRIATLNNHRGVHQLCQTIRIRCNIKLDNGGPHDADVQRALQWSHLSNTR